MENKKLVDGIKTILEPLLKEKNLVFYDTEIVKEDGNLIVRVTIDNPNGLIDIDSLAEINQYLSDRIDKYDSDMPEY
ncbi:MAG: hypothetical protein IKN46_03920, partial [Acholeplasmatales bacterium]|nr:hypothetical protein [Acholeplasmatales bacterium]